jgi:putative transposase
VRFAFIEREKADYAIALLCRVLQVSCSGYYAWRRRGPSVRAQQDAVVTARIQTIPEQSRQTYGAPRIQAELAATGTTCGRKRVARLMRVAGLVGCHRRRHVVTTQREPTAEPAPDQVQRQFVAAAPNQLWTADSTYVPTWTGFL